MPGKETTNTERHAKQMVSLIKADFNRLSRWYLYEVVILFYVFFLIHCEMNALHKYLQLPRKFPLRRAGMKSSGIKPQSMRDYDQSWFRIPGLENKSHSGIAGNIAFLISCTEWPSHSVIIITEMHWQRRQQTRGTHTHRKLPHEGK